jgi:hypothetical protein
VPVSLRFASGLSEVEKLVFLAKRTMGTYRQVLQRFAWDDPSTGEKERISGPSALQPLS